MNGTSLDGADFVLIEADSKSLSCQYLQTKSFLFGKKLKQELLAAVQHKLKVNELALLHHQLGRYYAECYRQLPVAMKKVQLIGLHGQTVFHQGGVATLQIGESSYLSAVSGKPVVSDFRVADLALGGEGAPLATFFHQTAFGQKNKTVSVHNLGGISNISLIHNKKLRLGFDTGPANMLLDMAMQIDSKNKKLFDQGGATAARGKVDSELLSQMLKHRFFKIKPPKSCGREEFGEAFYQQFKTKLHRLSLPDRMATLTELVAVSTARAYQNFCRPQPEQIIFCGGGAHNLFLIKRISAQLPNIEINTTAELGWPEQAIEGAAFALLAAAKLLNKKSNLPQSTGARRASSLGKVTSV